MKYTRKLRLTVGDSLCLVVQVNGPGDFSTYTLSLVNR